MRKALISSCDAVDRILEPQTIAHFLEFCSWGTLPTGKQTSLPKLLPEDIPFIDGPPPTSDNVGNSESIMSRVAERIGSFSDSSRLCLVGKNINSLKSRLWEGIVPLSEQRWREKRLDREENFDVAAQHISAVVAVFEYLNQPAVVANLRDTFNLIWDLWEEADVLVNRNREAIGKEKISLTKLWTEYMAAKYEVMTGRAHRWVILHVEALRAPLLRTLRLHRPINEDVVDRIQWKTTDQLHMLNEIASVADYTILMPMQGYKGWSGNVPIGAQGPLAERSKRYGPRLKQLTREGIYERALNGTRAPGRVASPGPLVQLALDQIDCQSRLRREIRGEAITMPKEPWITNALQKLEKKPEPMHESQGLMIYRITYGQTDEEWDRFLQRFQAHVDDWGRGHTGSSFIKPYLKLHWFDGKELGIPEGDVAAARKHFKEQPVSQFGDKVQVNRHVFLAVDDISFGSYTTDDYAVATALPLRGDFTGFVLAVDADYDPKEPLERPDESPGHHGQMRILGSLIWSDLFSGLSSQSAYPEDLWPLALDHPNQVYVGPTVPLTISDWRMQNGIRNLLLRQIVDYVKAKMDGTAPELPSQPENGSRDPLNGEHDPLRQHLMRNFVNWLRDNNHTREGIMAEEVMRARPGQDADMERIRQRMDALENGDEDEVNPPRLEDPDDPCPMQ
ncbi:hypothetical protein P170DRAFT_359206 [Aspergillus steynii IBT 23096]|uniref:Uncharacterized protein n=1 Tax=Aspergillus steynii IBT 23096 TaxID=1392250 RepID=A0A2I2G408_9EURO|nr:uncharacterized protein P170DRAFT_359206 [Aspergillus steynii IBT 23096]PLB47601.1 hypothetical protein P170DRAFT_359206 [Aspergillus steynii IBT 23096]